jgi:hypothetical protein
MSTKAWLPCTGTGCVLHGRPPQVLAGIAPSWL